MTNINTCCIGGQKTAPQQKGQMFASNSLDLTSAYQDVLWRITNSEGQIVGSDTTAWIDCGNAPAVALDIAWVTSSGTPLAAEVVRANDVAGVVIPVGAFIPTGTTVGARTAFPDEVSFPKADFGNAATCYVGGMIDMQAHRYMKVRLHAASTNGSAIVYATAAASS